MTRPQIIRADTLDLQDQTSPSAKDHSRQPQHPSPLGIGPAAPHQAAAVKTANDDRSIEEARLYQTWADEDRNLRDDPGSDDERTLIDHNEERRDEVAIRQNGGSSGSPDDSDMADADEDGADDDMMDKISSSPSIDDGGYMHSSSTWPPRGTSSTPTRQLLSTAAQHSPSPSPLDSSSPFTETPLHLPLSVVSGRVGSESAFTSENFSSHISPHALSPVPPSFNSGSTDSPAQLEYHHRSGEYPAPDQTMDSDSDSQIFLARPEDPFGQDGFEVTALRGKVETDPKREAARTLPSDDSPLNFGEDEIQSFLLPENDPLLDDDFDESTPELSPSVPDSPRPSSPDSFGSGDSWTTESSAETVWPEENHDDDDTNGVSFSDDPRYVDSGWGGDCLRETEDIDFEFVYALHTFVATVEGQANATKGDTMVLLDDSNSYWWLVRVVKDSSIGYLPAEHIETPTERLARLNKHRNIDLSAAMLGDTAEKPKNPLKKAMRRRNAKTVTFAQNTYIEASEYEYTSSEDDDEDEELLNGAEAADSQDKAATEAQSKVEPAAAEPAEANGAIKPAAAEPEQSEKALRGDEPDKASADRSPEKSPVIDETDKPLDQKVTRNGTMRNTDSFFKDDTAETRRITLTPKMLRDSSTGAKPADVKERDPSLESLEKNNPFVSDKEKEKEKEKQKDKKAKEKKPGMLSGLFKRKDKKTKGDGDGDSEKQSGEFSRASPTPPRRSDETPIEKLNNIENDLLQQQQQPQRTLSRGKLQKPQRTESQKKSMQPRDETSQNSAIKAGRIMSPDIPPLDVAGKTERPTARVKSPPADESTNEPTRADKTSTEESRSRPEGTKQTNPFSDPQESQQPQAQQQQKQQQELQQQRQLPQQKPADINVPDDRDADRLSDSPVNISPVTPPALVGDTSSQEERSISPISPVSSPELIENPDSAASSTTMKLSQHSTNAPSQTLSSATNAAGGTAPRAAPSPINTAALAASQSPVSNVSSAPTWSDASLRHYLEDPTVVRDLLLVIHDTSGVVPAGPEHPLMAGLFDAEKSRVKELEGQLDGILVGWLGKKKAGGGRATPTVSANGAAGTATKVGR